MEFPIIYEDADLLVVNKPAGITVHGGPGIKGPTIAEWLLNERLEVRGVGDDPLRPGIVHRLDRDTSGVLVIAKNQPIFEYVKQQFTSREIEKRYLALVVGEVKREHGEIALPLGASPKDIRKRITPRGSKLPKRPREAVTEWKVLKRFPGYTLLEVFPKTGRTHQIRAHLKAIGHPVACDPVYGSMHPTCPAGLTRQFLHANFLQLTLPDGRVRAFEADLPEDLAGALDELTKI
ncbi:RluA family pseudouridine synthase [Candidatus Azambacteria bacterium]|nr:RluA family pseudouridine synthase [Candidatus Azambacteria bacterium]